ncbi:MAG: DUF4956 domain-containing protein [Oscillospiraceae bacterium]|nr:DUF4956 domain-containing protein [Oscillospiraceae bacterium]MDE5885700.1 DUF4956 domain-containing protein [Oscillospiraceae bacterium]
MNNIFDSVISYDALTQSTNFSMATFLGCMLCALVIGFGISMIYMLTRKKEGYAQSYALTLIMLPPIVCVLLLLIDTVAGGLAIAGVFTLTRFRSVAGDPKDICFVFMAMACGVIFGKGYITIGIIFFIIMAVVLYTLNLLNYAAPKANDMTLKISVPENLNYEHLFDAVLDKYTTSWRLRRVKTTNFGSMFDCIYSIQLPMNVDQKKFLDELRTLNGNMTITLTLFRYEDRLYEVNK